MTVWFLVAAVALLVANGFFVAVEFALIASRRSSLEPLARRGDRRAVRALRAASQLNLQLAGSQLGITMASLALGAVAEPAIADLLEDGLHRLVDLPDAATHAIAAAVTLVVVVLAHTVIGEMIPKNIAIAAPERTLLALTGVNRLYVGLFGPVIRVLNAAANVLTRAVGVEPRDERSDQGVTHSADELARLLAESRREGVLADTAHDLLTGALRLGGRDIGSIMVPADQVVAVQRSATVADAEAAIVQSGLTRLLIRDDSDAVIGFLHAKDLLTVPAAARRRPLPIARIRRVLVLERSVPLSAALVTMRRSRIHVAAVVDGTRTFVGLATLEDVLESVVGDIIDESD